MEVLYIQSSKVLIGDYKIQYYIEIAYHFLYLLLTKILSDQPMDGRGDSLLAFLHSSNNLALSDRENVFCHNWNPGRGLSSPNNPLKHAP